MGCRGHRSGRVTKCIWGEGRAPSSCACCEELQRWAESCLQDQGVLALKCMAVAKSLQGFPSEGDSPGELLRAVSLGDRPACGQELPDPGSTAQGWPRWKGLTTDPQVRKKFPSREREGGGWWCCQAKSMHQPARQDGHNPDVQTHALTRGVYETPPVSSAPRDSPTRSPGDGIHQRALVLGGAKRYVSSTLCQVWL